VSHYRSSFPPEASKICPNRRSEWRRELEEEKESREGWPLYYSRALGTYLERGKGRENSGYQLVSYQIGSECSYLGGSEPAQLPDRESDENGGRGAYGLLPNGESG